MAKTAVLNVETKLKKGKKFNKKLRKQGKIPAVVYGHGLDTEAIELNLHDFTEMLHHGNRLFEVMLGNNKQNLLVKEIQYDHLGRYIIHADMMRVDLSETIRVSVPLDIKGTAKGAVEGGIVDVLMANLEVECRAAEIPAAITVSVKELEVGQTIKAGDIALPEGAKLVTDAAALVLHCHLVSVAKTTEEVEAEAPAVPEVITERAKEPEEGQSE